MIGAPARGGTAPSVLVPKRSDDGQVRIIPFDHVASFDLAGKPGATHQDVINTGVEGVFVAVAVGYGMSEVVRGSVEIADVRDGEVLKDVSVWRIPGAALMDGVRLDPGLSALWLREGASGLGASVDLDIPVSRANELGILQSLAPASEISFTYSLVDTGTGRELQNAPVQSRAGLGAGDGGRPFRMLARPFAFMPRSSLRVDVRESSRVKGRLQLALHGFKILGTAGLPEDRLRRIYTEAMRQMSLHRASANVLERLTAGHAPTTRIIPFDHVGKVTLEGTPGRVDGTEVPINVDGSFVATSIGYGVEASLSGPDAKVLKELPGDDAGPPTAQLSLSRISDAAWRAGFRLRKDRLHLSRSWAVPAGELFEFATGRDRVEFLYTFEDTGTGRPWQDAPVHSIAGLGTASGERPFRRLAWPMTFLPRSTFRIRIEEVSRTGPGTLYIALQGYKILG